MCPLPPQEAGVTASGDEGVLSWSKDYVPAQPFVVANSMLRLPASYARTAFHAVHAFDVEGSDKRHRMVRFALEPSDGVRSTGPADPSRPPIEAALRPQLLNEFGTTLPADYLRQELRDRLRYAPSRFNLRMQIAEPWDDTSDLTRVWPSNRRRVLMGTLRISEVIEDQEAGCEELDFNPGRLLPGMDVSDDPVLRDRAAVYSESYRRRMEVRRARCPVAEG
jgi:catalase